MVGGEPEEKTLGEGKCSDTYRHKSLHSYILQSCMLVPCSWGMPLHLYIYKWSLIHTQLFYNVINPVRATKESDLSVEITYPLSAVSCSLLLSFI